MKPIVRSRPNSRRSLDNGHRKGVVDQEGTHEDGHAAHEVQANLVIAQHLGHLLALGSRENDRVGLPQGGLQAGFERFQVSALAQLGLDDQVDLVDLAFPLEHFLSEFERQYAERAVIQLPGALTCHQANHPQPDQFVDAHDFDRIAGLNLVILGEIFHQHHLTLRAAGLQETPGGQGIFAHLRIEGRVDAIQAQATQAGPEKAHPDLGGGGLVGQNGLDVDRRHGQADAWKAADFLGDLLVEAVLLDLGSGHHQVGLAGGVLEQARDRSPGRSGW